MFICLVSFSDLSSGVIVTDFYLNRSALECIVWFGSLHTGFTQSLKVFESLGKMG